MFFEKTSKPTNTPDFYFHFTILVNHIHSSVLNGAAGKPSLLIKLGLIGASVHA